MFATRTLVMATSLVLLASNLNAQAPQYEPYGAWRGRIHYVDRQQGIRTHVRWGGGLTPVGGQVLMNLTNVAGDVASQYLNQSGGGGGSREVNPELISAITALNDNNEAIRNALNPTLVNRLKLDPVPPFKTVTSSTPAVPAQEGVDIRPKVPNANERRARIKQLEDMNAINKQELIAAAYKALATGNATNAITPLSAMDTERLKALDAVIKQLQLPAPSPAPTGDTKLEQFNEQMKAVVAVVERIKNVLKEHAEVAGGLIVDTSEDPENKYAKEIESGKKVFEILKSLKP